MEFIQESNGIYRLKVPFEDLYTSVFLIETAKGNVLVDCATTEKDVIEYILPALHKKGLLLADIRWLVLTHRHGDHAGGLKQVLQLHPKVEIIAETDRNFSDDLTICKLKGHTLDCIGILDKRTETLISGDALQGAGIGKYRCTLESKGEYIKTIGRLKKNKSIKNILFSHAYEPWYSDGVFGRMNVEKCLQDCIDVL